MRITIEINEELICAAMRLSRVKTKKLVVELALETLINQIKRRRMKHLFGKTKWEGDLSKMRQL